jgi:hypothetical protein
MVHRHNIKARRCGPGLTPHSSGSEPARVRARTAEFESLGHRYKSHEVNRVEPQIIRELFSV